MLRKLSFCLLLGVIVLAWPSLARADLIRFTSVLNGAQETPPNASPGSGFGEFIYDTNTNRITSGTLTFGGLVAPIINAHIHAPAPPGVAAGVIRGFPPPIPASIVSPYNLTLLTQAQVFPQIHEGNLLNNRSYFNIHTTQFQGGEIRGQIINQGPVPEPATFALFLVGGAGLAGARWMRRRRR